ncbi:MAG: hybrid sensor histidine kinase/response regulator [Leptolyngbyaceae cyanobacterium bins.302]|nr:hybrid sensor histidine kinase/response regulator [Leptolyngbyaceae cyanobacterium bins.302]
MSLQGIYLREFAQAIPVCNECESLGSTFERFHQHQSDRLVLVNAHQHPLGLIRLNSLLPHLATAITQPVSSQTPNDTGRALQELAATVVEPLIVLPDGWAVEQFLAAMPVNEEYALVNHEAQFVGLLDRDRLMRHLLTLSPDYCSANSTGNNSSEKLRPVPAIEFDAFKAEHSLHTQQQQILTLTQQLLVQRAELEQRLKTQQAEINRLKKLPLAKPAVEGAKRANFPIDLGAVLSPSQGATNTPPPLLAALLQLLERLPLPLMLQTNEGAVLAQNSVWCQQVGKLSDPVRIWHEASVWLGTRTSEPQIKRDSKPSLGVSEFALRSTAIDPLPLPQDAFPANQSLCQLGGHPDSCVCVCALKDGREQVVQFIKISLGTLLPNLELDWATTLSPYVEAVQAQVQQIQPETIAAAIASPFQLATLTPSGSASSSESTLDRETSSSVARAATASLSLETVPSALQSLWLVMAQDVTQQQHLARELTAKNADLVQLNRLKDEFLACISHELKTPLTAVLGLSSLLKDQTLGKLNQRQVHYAQLIYQSSRHLMGVVNDILDLTRIETGQLELLYGLVDIPTICSRAFEQAKQARLAEGKDSPSAAENPGGTQVSLEIEPNLGSLVADELRLRQMLVHLLSNSLKFTEENSAIGLKVNRWGGWIAFTVWDTGIGIPAEKQHLIFQKFQQLENPLTRQFEGAGLGLVLTRRLARLHGGDVTFLSKEGTGSQFTILLPPTPPDKTQLTKGSALDDDADAPTPTMDYPNGRVPVYVSKTERESPQSVTLGSNVRDRLVLIVDAVPQFVESLTDQLTGLGYRVVIARSGTEALEKARRLQPCVIFLNPLLPLLSGWDVLTLLKSGAETQHLPVVVTATVIDEERAHQNQANGFLKFPIQTQKLQAILQQLFLSPERHEVYSPPNALTILRLFCMDSEGEELPQWLDLSEALRSHQYRILESDDLEQAELLAGVWKPNVLLLEGAIPSPTVYLQHLSHCPVLASLPIVTLDLKVAQAANQIPGLQVFPCLLNGESAAVSHDPHLSTLLQVIQVAAGCLWQPSILAIEMSLRTEMRSPPDSNDTLECSPDVRGSFPHETEWLQALVQYLQTAGLNALVGQSWQEVLQQLNSQSVDLLLLCWTDGEPQPEIMERLVQLHELNPKPPVIVLDHRDPGLGETTSVPLPQQVRELATQILSPPIAMAELLEQIQHTLR